MGVKDRYDFDDPDTLYWADLNLPPHQVEYVLDLKPRDDGAVMTLLENPRPEHVPAEWTPAGVHKPTAEAFLLVMASFLGIEPDTLKRVQGAVEGGGPIR